MIFEVGRVCMKIAGRDANKVCAVIKQLDENNVEIDGQTRRRKCGINHLEPLELTIDIKEGASNKDVAEALTKAGFPTTEKVERKPKTPAKKNTAKKVVKKEE